MRVCVQKVKGGMKAARRVGGVERSAVFLAVVVVVTFMAYGVFYQSPHAVERAVGFGSGAVGLISFAYAVYRGLVNAISNHAARWARENIVKPIAAFLVVANEDLKRKPLDEVAADAQKAKTIAETILKALGE